MAEHHVGLLRDHHPGAVAEAAEQARGFGQQVLERAGLALNLPGDLAALALVDLADLEHGIDEKPEALLRRLPAGRGVRRRDQPQILEVGHDVAHRGGAEADRQHAAQVARTDGGAGVEIALDDLAKDVLAARIEHREEIFGDLRHGAGAAFRSNCDCNHLGKNGPR